MKLTKGKRILLTVIMIVAVLVFTSTTAFAAINEDYGSSNEVDNNHVGEAISDSTLLNLLARLVYGVGQMLEWLLGVIFQLLTGSSDFPWADKIVFNAVPLLDVNFINPDTNSFVGNEGIKGVLKSIYSTILALSSSFFGIFVLITAIKLAISTIASEKAKYKQAIVDWLIGFVTLFCIHYAISFIFYLNEQLVVVASKMVSGLLENAGDVIIVQVQDKAAELIEKVRKELSDAEAKGLTANAEGKVKVLEDNPRVLETWMTSIDANKNSQGLHEVLMRYSGPGGRTDKALYAQYDILVEMIRWAVSASPTYEELVKLRANMPTLDYSGREAALTQDQLTSLFGNADRVKWFTKQPALRKNECLSYSASENIYMVTSVCGDGYHERV